jgi:transaldolase
MKKAGVINYEKFAKEVLNEIQDKPISFELFSDDLQEMKRQAKKIASWGNNVFVKVPITNSFGASTQSVLEALTQDGIKVNVTAVMTPRQVNEIVQSLSPEIESYVSVFAGRIADTGRDPVPIMRDCLNSLAINSKSKLIWASPRELLNVIQAHEIGCHIITATSEILNKVDLIGRNLEEYSLETVKMFSDDAKNAGYTI